MTSSLNPVEPVLSYVIPHVVRCYNGTKGNISTTLNDFDVDFGGTPCVIHLNQFDNSLYMRPLLSEFSMECLSGTSVFSLNTCNIF